jgi:uncharacterized protein YbaR (Trm112 family)
MSEYVILTDDRCILCHEAPGEGAWQLCGECRSQLANEHHRKMALRAPTVCLGCYAPRRTLPELGSIYCPRCRERFHVRGG